MPSSLRPAALAALTFVAAACVSSPKVSEAACQPGWALCGSACTSLQTDAVNCGACGNACGRAQVCSAGRCSSDCQDHLLSPVIDATGMAWDGTESGSTAFAAARETCARFGGRLPTVSELVRASGAKAGALAGPARTAPLWSLAPHAVDSAFTVNLADGAPESPAPGLTSPRAYRCVCPPPRPAAFTGTSCYGPPGNECAPIFGGRWNIDREDRPALSLPAAVFECAASGGELPTSERLVAAIPDGVPNGTNDWLHTSDVVSVYDGNNQIRDTVEGLVQFTGTTVNAFEWGFWHQTRAFRCVGPAAAWDPPAIATSFAASRGGRAVDLDPEAAGSYSTAVARCWQKGGQLPTALELAALVTQGLPARSYHGLRLTSDQVRGFDDDGRVESLAWDGEVRWDVEPALASTTADRNTVILALADVGLRDKLKFEALPFQCAYAAVDPSVTRPADGTCAGGQPCLEVPSGNGRVRFWIDAVDRGAATFVQAASECARRGGRLPSGRDYLLAIRAGLAGSGASLLTSDRVGWAEVKGIAWTSGTFDPASWVDASSNAARVAWNAPASGYRCMWTNEVR